MFLLAALVGCSSAPEPTEAPVVAPAPPPRKLPPGLRGPEFAPIGPEDRLHLIPRQVDGRRCVAVTVAGDPFLRQPRAREDLATLPCHDLASLERSYPDLGGRADATELATVVSVLELDRRDLSLDERSLGRVYGTALAGPDDIRTVGLDRLHVLGQNTEIPDPEKIYAPELVDGKLLWSLIGPDPLELSLSFGSPWALEKTPLPRVQASAAPLQDAVREAFKGGGEGLLQFELANGSLLVLTDREEGAHAALFLEGDRPLAGGLPMPIALAFKAATRTPEERQRLAAGLFAFFGPEDRDPVGEPRLKGDVLTVDTVAEGSDEEIALHLDLAHLGRTSRFRP